MKTIFLISLLAMSLYAGEEVQMVLSADQKTITVANLNSRLSYAFRKAFNETYDQNSGYNSSQGGSVSFIYLLFFL